MSRFFYLTLVLVSSIGLSSCIGNQQKSAVQIESKPGAKVTINGNDAGSTPYRYAGLKPGKVEIILTADNGQKWQKTVTLRNLSTTVIAREFSENGGGGYVLYMETNGDKEKAGLIVSATPDKAAVTIDGTILGYAPTRFENIGSGKRQIKISYPGYKSLTIMAEATNGYDLVLETELDRTFVPTPTPTTTAISDQPLGGDVVYVHIRSPETGWLRVRQEPSSSSSEIARVDTNDKFVLIEEENGWYKIKVEGKEGWVNAKYAEKSKE